MSTKIITQLKVRTKTHAEWAAANPVIPIGEAARSSDVNSHLIRKGDGQTKWSLLTDYDPDVTTAPHAASHLAGGRDPINLSELGGAPGYQVQYTLPPNSGWYRIARSWTSGTTVLNSILSITGTVANYHTSANIATSLMYTKYPVLSQLSCSQWTNPSFTKIRIVYPSNDYNGNPSYIEIYHTVTAAETILSVSQFGATRYSWVLFPTATEGDATLPSGYTSKELILQPGVSISDLAKALCTPRTIGITGGATGTPISFDGSKNVVIPVTQLDSTLLKATDDSVLTLRYYDCGFFCSQDPLAGSFKIGIPKITEDTKFCIDMEIIEYNTSRSTKMQLKGTLYENGNAITGGSCASLGYPYSVKVGYETDRYNIYLQDPTYTWTSVQICISKVTLYGSGRNSLNPKDFTFGVVTNNTTGITNPVNLIINNTLTTATAKALTQNRQFSIAGEVNAPVVDFDGTNDVELQGYLNLLYNTTRDYTTPTIVIGSDNNAYLWIKANGPDTANGTKNPVTAGNTEYWKKIGGSLAISRIQSAANERKAVIAKNTNYTVPAYTVGKNNLSVYIGGLKGLVGTDANKHLYKEIGSAGATSTTIQFLDDISKEHDLSFEVINVS